MEATPRDHAQRSVLLVACLLLASAGLLGVASATHPGPPPVVDRAEGSEAIAVAWHIQVDEGARFGVRAYAEGAGNRTAAYAWTAHLAPAESPDEPFWAAARTVAFSSTQTEVHHQGTLPSDGSLVVHPRSPVHVPFLTSPEGLGISTWWVAQEPGEWIYTVLGDAEGWWHGEFDVLGEDGVEILAKSTGSAALVTEGAFASDDRTVVDGPFNSLRYREIDSGEREVQADDPLWAQYVVVGDAHDDGLEIGFTGPAVQGHEAREYHLWGEGAGAYAFTLDWPAVASSEQPCLAEQAIRATTGVSVPYQTCADWTVVLLTAAIASPVGTDGTPAAS